MTASDRSAVTVLGMGAMGRALAGALVDAGYTTTVWNRSPGRAVALADRGARVAGTIDGAVSASPLVIACFLDHASVHEVLDPVARRLTGRSLVNLTTTTPNQARQLAAWADRHAVRYLDGGIMAVPDMIGRPGSALLYSGSGAVFDEHEALLGVWGERSYLGPDAGMATLYDLAMLSGMYLLFAGFIHGAATVGSVGVPATEFASRGGPFLAAMAGGFAEFAKVIDGGDYSVAGQQSLEFSDLGDLLQPASTRGSAPR